MEKTGRSDILIKLYLFFIILFINFFIIIYFIYSSFQIFFFNSEQGSKLKQINHIKRGDINK